MIKTAHIHCIKRRPSYIGRENPQWHRTSCEIDHDQDRTLNLCFGVGQTKGNFFNSSLKFAPKVTQNSGPEECYSDHLLARGPFALSRVG